MRYPECIESCTSFFDLDSIITSITDRFASRIRECALCCGDKEIAEFLSEDRVMQFCTASMSICTIIIDINLSDSKALATIDAINERRLLTQSWIMLGSATESLLQLWLSVYLFDVKKSQLFSDYIWSIDFDTVEKRIKNTLVTLSNEGIIKEYQQKALMGVIKQNLKRHKGLPSVEDMTFAKLNAFFRDDVRLLEQVDIDNLEMIRNRRNIVHAFIPKDIGMWSELLKAIRFYCSLLLQLSSMLPDCSDVMSAEGEMHEAMRQDMP